MPVRNCTSEPCDGAIHEDEEGTGDRELDAPVRVHVHDKASINSRPVVEHAADGRLEVQKHADSRRVVSLAGVGHGVLLVEPDSGSYCRYEGPRLPVALQGASRH